MPQLPRILEPLRTPTVVSRRLATSKIPCILTLVVTRLRPLRVKQRPEHIVPPRVAQDPLEPLAPLLELDLPWRSDAIFVRQAGLALGYEGVYRLFEAGMLIFTLW